MGTNKQSADLIATVDNKNQATVQDTGSVVDPDKKVRYERIPMPPDGGYGWVIVIAGAALSFVSLCGLMTFGIFLVELVNIFNVKKGYISWIGSIMMSIIAPMGPLLPPLLDRFGSRVMAIISAVGLCVSFILTSVAPDVPFLFFSMGFLTGTCACVMYMSGQVIVQNYFHKKRALASSLSILGTAIAMFIWPPLTRVLIDTYSWRGASLIIGGIALNGMVFGALLRPPPMQTVPKRISNGCQSVNKEDSALKTSRCCFLTRKYLTRILMFWGWFFLNASHILTVTYTPVRAQYLGISKTKGALLLSVLGAVSGIVRVGAGWLGDRPFVTRNILAGAASVYCGALTIISISFTTFPAMLVFMLLYGLGGAIYVGLQGACVYDVVGLKNISYGFSILFVALGSSCFICISLAGYLYDLTGRPLETVIAFGVVQILGGIFLSSIPFVQKHLRKQSQSQQENLEKL